MGSTKSTLVKIPHCWKSHVVAHILKTTALLFTCYVNMKNGDTFYIMDLCNYSGKNWDRLWEIPFCHHGGKNQCNRYS